MTAHTRHEWNRLTSRLDSFGSRTSLVVRVWTDCGAWELIGRRLCSSYVSHETWEISGSGYGVIRTITDGYLLAAATSELVATVEIEDGLVWLGPFGDAGRLWTGWERLPTPLRHLVKLAGLQLYVKDEKLVGWCPECHGPVRAISGAHHQDGCSATPADETHVGLGDPGQPINGD